MELSVRQFTKSETGNLVADASSLGFPVSQHEWPRGFTLNTENGPVEYSTVTGNSNWFTYEADRASWKHPRIRVFND